MSKIVHVQTTIQTIFGLLDDDGNVIPQQPVVVNVGRFDESAFSEAHAAIAQARDRAASNYEAQESSEAPKPVARRPKP